MEKSLKKISKIFLTILEIGLVYILLSNIILFIPVEKGINQIVKFLFENLYIVFIFTYNIRTWILLKSEKEKEMHTAVIFASILNVLYFMDKIVLTNFLEVFVFYAIAVIFMLFLLFKLGLIGEKHSMYRFKTNKIIKTLVILSIFLVIAGEFYAYFNKLNMLNNILENTKDNEKIIKLFNKEKITLFIKTGILLVSSIIILVSKTNNKTFYKINTLNGLILLIISVFGNKNTCIYYLSQIIFTNYFVNNYLEIKKKIELE